MQNKLVGLKDAVNLINNGDTIAVGGVINSRSPIAIIHEMIRAGLTDLDLISLDPTYSFDVLIGAGSVRSIDFAYCGMVSPKTGFAHLPCFRRAAESGQIEVKENVGSMLIASLDLGGLIGGEFTAFKTITGLDILKHRPEYFKEIISPFTGEKLIAIPPYEPAVGIIHVQKADCFGNAIIEDPGFNLDLRIAFASKKVIITAEEIVEHEKIRGLINIPYFTVSAVTEVAKGAHPTACYKYYEVDYDFLENYLDMASTREGFDEYLNQYVLGVTDHKQYLEMAEKIVKSNTGGSM
jgi:glutaconate CoA-transferase subunit A